MNRATLSVIIPNYNHGRYLRELLLSLLTQSRLPDEIIVVDDGSTDDSVSVIEAIAEQNQCIKLHRNPKNLGVVATLNRAIDLASGDYLTFPSADNFVLPGMYEKSMAILEQFPAAGLCCSDPVIYNDITADIHASSLDLSKEASFFSAAEVLQLTRKKGFCAGNICHTTVVKKDAMREVAADGNYYLPELKWHCDFFAINAIAFRHGMCYIPEKLAMFRWVPTSYSQKKHPWKVVRGVYHTMIDVLNRPQYAAIKPAFKKSTVLAEFSYSMLSVLVVNPLFYEFLVPSYLKRALHASWSSFVSFLRVRVARIPIAKKIFRLLKKFFCKS
ncbi:MAG: glycosyltransferase family 2 protein [Simkaniaceae bacterium]|nr:glycosyltransferase family 2 protein [Simkaniaceae bacterium]